jgi:hypothetical protein
MLAARLPGNSGYGTPREGRTEAHRGLPYLNGRPTRKGLRDPDAERVAPGSRKRRPGVRPGILICARDTTTGPVLRQLA